MSASPPMAPDRAIRVPLPSPFALMAGGRLVGAEVAMETYGRLNPARDNALLLFTGLSASAHAASHPSDPSNGWWEAMIGPGKALDTEQFFVISVNSLGSCFGSTGPGSIDPTTGQPYGDRFPELRIEDIARASQAAVDALGIEQLAGVIGMSLGGMTALAHAACFPGRARSLVSISGAVAATASAIATRSLQREIVGTALRSGAGPEAVNQAMRLARKIGVMSYVGSELLEKRFGREQSEPYAGRGSGTDFEVENWLDHLATKFARQFEPWSYWALSRAMDLFDFGRVGDTSQDPSNPPPGCQDAAVSARADHRGQRGSAVSRGAATGHRHAAHHRRHHHGLYRAVLAIWPRCFFNGSRPIHPGLKSILELAGPPNAHSERSPFGDLRLIKIPAAVRDFAPTGTIGGFHAR